MKIGILTFHRSQNYGSVLQAFALSSFINNALKQNAEIVDYVPEAINNYNIFVSPKSLRDVVRNAVSLANFHMRKMRRDGFTEFLNNRLPLSRTVTANDNCARFISDNYDAVICGSDQIWCPDAPEFQSIYFLHNVTDCKKIAYAASIGNGKLTDQVKVPSVKEDLLDFRGISMRENDGCEQIKSITHRNDVNTVVDPTLLLESKDYDRICSPRLINNDYIFFYSVGFNKQDAEFVRALSKATKKPVYTLFSNTNSLKYKSYGVKFAKHQSPEDFLSLVKYADLVISSSFHGTAFSVIYKKTFFSLFRIDENKNVITDNRIENLLKELGLTSRIKTILDVGSLELSQPQFDDKRFAEFIEKSKVYLTKQMELCNEQEDICNNSGV